ncbi:MAG: uroporphyrinogen-III C-methyltransferase [Kineothrix sp.]
MQFRSFGNPAGEFIAVRVRQRLGKGWSWHSSWQTVYRKAEERMGKVYLVGAGPGDAGLITVKGLEKLSRCDAVVYDRLAAEELLEVVPPDCEKIYVGKEAGRHSKRQEEINHILVESAGTHRNVVRLKGGDPFVFGRGGEEIEALREHGIPYEVIPGVTSAVAVPECAGIPVTHRGVARSFHVITGHTQASFGCPAYDYEALGKMEGTLVFLMGLANLRELAHRLICAGKPTDTPAAVISDGTTVYQKMVKGTLGTIAEGVKEGRLRSPAVIVIGETAGCEYGVWPAVHKRAGIVATKLLRKKLEPGLEELGISPIPVCNMKVVETEQMKELGEELKRLDQYQWILFTSQNGVRLFFQGMKQQHIDVRALGGIRFAALGSGTAAKLLEYGIQADFLPSAYTASVLAEEFAKAVKKKERVLIPRAVQGSKEVTEVLAREGIEFSELAIYDVAGSMTGNIQVLEALDYLIFVSASGVTAFFDELRIRKLSLPDRIRIACIGKITEKRLLEIYGKADIVAAVNDAEGLLDGIRAAEEGERIQSRQNNNRGEEHGAYEETACK